MTELFTDHDVPEDQRVVKNWGTEFYDLHT